MAQLAQFLGLYCRCFGCLDILCGGKHQWPVQGRMPVCLHVQARSNLLVPSVVSLGLVAIGGL
jgi:hypothetical protein